MELKKHLKVHANRGHIEEQEIERVFSISDKGARKRGPPRGHGCKGGSKLQGQEGNARNHHLWIQRQ